MATLLAAVELGGMKALAAVGTNLLAPLRRTRVPTTDLLSTLGAVAAFLAPLGAETGLAGGFDLAPSMLDVAR